MDAYVYNFIYKCVCVFMRCVCALISLINVADIAGDLTLIGTSKTSIIF